MEGLLIAEVLARLEPLLPADRAGWSFPSPARADLPLREGVTLRLDVGRDPAVTLGPEPPSRSAPQTPFQRQLAARAAGRLEFAEQRGLDRVFTLEFAGSGGFVPEPPLALVVELTGRNANLVLVSAEGTVLGAHRVVTSSVNRHRELVPGRRYVPPPDYVKLDPRSSGEDAIREVLAGRALADVRTLLDGVGAKLQRALESRLADVVPDPRAALDDLEVEAVVRAVAEMVAGPAAFLAAHGREAAGGGAESSEDPGLTRRLTAALTKDLKVAERRLADAHRAADPGEEPAALRAEADLLLSVAASWLPDGENVTVTGPEGEVVLEIDPQLDAVANAQARYERARRREARARRAAERLPGLSTEVDRLRDALGGVGSLGAAELRRALKELEAGDQSAARRSSPTTVRSRAPEGLRIAGPHGFEVVVGRSAKENDTVTFKLARSLDVWLHAQGYRGAHVIIRSGGREVPFDTVLFAARLAAGHSEARSSSNVPVDYTLRKHVWRQKGAARGAVNYAHQKTVYVDPARDGDTAGQ